MQLRTVSFDAFGGEITAARFGLVMKQYCVRNVDVLPPFVLKLQAEVNVVEGNREMLFVQTLRHRIFPSPPQGTPRLLR
jgi:hypothetical protein